MAANKKEFALGAGLMVVFLVVLVVMFMPIFGGLNSMQYLDNLYNSISKGSAYYIPAAQEEAKGLDGKEIDATVTMKDEVQAQRTAQMLVAAGAQAQAQGAQLTVDGDLGAIYQAALQDADDLYHNRKPELEARYDFAQARAVLYNWWTLTGLLGKELDKEQRFDASKILGSVNKRALEMSYNYYGVVPKKITDRWGTVLGSLIFYVVYTLWYGFAILFMFEGAGFRLEH